jgi:hypothetical protein
MMGPDCLIIDIDFRSYFGITRAIDSYGTMLNSLPVECVLVPFPDKAVHEYDGTCEKIVPKEELYALPRWTSCLISKQNGAPNMRGNTCTLSKNSVA